MSHKCYLLGLLGKKNLVVYSVTHKGKARAAGKVGCKVTELSRQVQKTYLQNNLQKKTILEQGTTNTIWLSVHAICSLTAVCSLTSSLIKGAFKGMEIV